MLYVPSAAGMSKSFSENFAIMLEIRYGPLVDEWRAILPSACDHLITCLTHLPLGDFHNFWTHPTKAEKSVRIRCPAPTWRRMRRAIVSQT